MYRRRFLRVAMAVAALTLVFGGAAESSAARRVKLGTIVVQVYREPRPGRRIKLANQLVRLNTGQTALTNRYGVAVFSKMPYGGYYARAGAYQSSSGGLHRSVLRLQIAVR